MYLKTDTDGLAARPLKGDRDAFGKNLEEALGKPLFTQWLDSGTDLTFTKWKEQNGYE